MMSVILVMTALISLFSNLDSFFFCLQEEKRINKKEKISMSLNIGVLFFLFE